MTNENLLSFYQEIYFSEIDMKEKLVGRLQLSTALIFAAISIVVFLLKNIDYSAKGGVSLVFWIAFILLIIALALSAWFFVRSWWGHAYKMLPTLRETEDYRQELLDTYKDYDGGDEIASDHFDNYLIKYFADCAGLNSITNDRRGHLLHNCNTSLIFAVIPLLITFFLFYFGELDKSSAKSAQELEMIDQNSVHMGPR